MKPSKHDALPVLLLGLLTACGGQVELSNDDAGNAGMGGTAGGSGGGASGGDVGGAPSARPSCRSGAPGAGENCGQAGDIDCCGSATVPGGTFNRLNDPALPATVSGFDLDRFEVTVGRFRAFVDAYPESRPSPGDGANPAISGSGWRSEWDASLPETRQALLDLLVVDIFDRPCSMWTDTPAEYEHAPIGCVSWYVAFAFCAWDDGRLPTVAEWLFAAAGGDEQRVNPWGSAPYDPSRAVYDNPPGGALIPVGSKPDGRARWGHDDMGGSRIECTVDFVGLDPNDLPVPCVDCADMLPEHDGLRAERDIGYHQDPVSVVELKSFISRPEDRQESSGLRCVHLPDPP
ncbi:MAG: formylglycine-generating enzyme family protein [Myxococcota bacterium]